MAIKLAALLLLVYSQLVLSFKQGDSIPIYYNKVFSLQNQLSYSYQSLGFVCPTTFSRKKSLLVFDQDLRGDRLVESNYKVHALGLNASDRRVLTAVSRLTFWRIKTVNCSVSNLGAWRMLSRWRN